MYFCFSHAHIRFAFTWTSSISSGWRPISKQQWVISFVFLVKWFVLIIFSNNNLNKYKEIIVKQHLDLQIFLKMIFVFGIRLSTNLSLSSPSLPMTHIIWDILLLIQILFGILSFSSKYYLGYSPWDILLTFKMQETCKK